MRGLILIAAGALLASACGDKQAAENGAASDGNAAAESIASNDTTAIDAATGEDANMAADVEFTVNEGEDPGNEDNSAEDSATGNQP